MRQLGRLRIGVPNVPYYLDKVKTELPAAEVVPLNSIAAMFGPEGKKLDALVLTAERGSAWTLLHPELAVVVPMPRPIKVPLAYPLAPDPDFAKFVDIWINLKAQRWHDPDPLRLLDPRPERSAASNALVSDS